MKDRIVFCSSVAIACLTLSVACGQDLEFVSSTLWSDVQDIEVVGPLAYCALPNGLIILDVSDPSIPEEVGRVFCPGSPRALDVIDKYAYVVTRYLGLRIIDVSSPNAPYIFSACQTAGDPHGMCVAGDYVYIAGGYPEGLQIVEVIDPEHPRLVSSHPTPGWCSGVEIVGDYAYIVDGGNGIYIADISDPAHPTYAGQADEFTAAIDMSIHGKYLYGIDLEGADRQPDDSYLITLDLTIPTAPSFVSRFHDFIGIGSVAASDDYVFLGGLHDWDGLVVVDVSCPEEPTRVAEIPIVGNCYGTRLFDDQVYMIEDLSGLEIFDVTEPTTPSFLGGWVEAQFPYDVCTKDGYAFVVDRTFGLYVVDIGNPLEPSIETKLPLSGRPAAISIRDEYAFIADFDEGLRVFDISTPTEPRPVGPVESPPALNLLIHGDLIFLCTHDYGVCIYDARDPENVELISSCYTQDHYVFNAVVKGNFLYIALGVYGFQIYDIADLENPILRGSCDPTLYAIRDLVILGEYAIAAVGQYGLATFWVGDPDFPEFRVAHAFGYPYNLEIDGTDLYVASGWMNGLWVLDVSNPLLPLPLTTYVSAGCCYNLHLNDPFIYYADYTSLTVMTRHFARIEPPSPRAFDNDITLHLVNPMCGRPEIRLELEQAANLNVDVHDILGRRCVTLHAGPRPAGELRLTWDASDWPTGAYFIRVLRRDRVRTRSFILTH